MGMSTVTAGRILKGQQLGGPGEDYRLTFETFPYVGLSKVLATIVLSKTVHFQEKVTKWSEWMCEFGNNCED